MPTPITAPDGTDKALDALASLAECPAEDVLAALVSDAVAQSWADQGQSLRRAISDWRLRCPSGGV